MSAWEAIWVWSMQRWRSAVLALALGLTVVAAPLGARADEVEVSDKARELFGKGVDLLEHPDGPKYEEAYDVFQQAYADSPSPKILGNLGLCAMNLERDGEAIAAYERYLAEVPDADFQERQRINKDLETLRGRSTKLTLRTTPAGVKIVDKSTSEAGEPLQNEYQGKGSSVELGLHAGKHELEVSAAGYKTSTVEVELTAGEAQERDVKLSKEAPPPAPTPTPTPSPGAVGDTPPGGDETTTGSGGLGGVPMPVIIGAAVTGLAVIGLAITGGLALKAKSDYKSFETGGDRKDAEDIRATGEKLNHAATAMLVLAAAAGTATLVLFFVLPGDDSGGAAQLTIAPQVGLDGGGAQMRLTF